MAIDEKKKRSIGRPKAEIDWNTVDNLLKAGCTGVSIADRFGIHKDTLYDACVRDHNTDFSAYSQQKRAVGDDLLRTKQFDLAMKGDRTMLIWLGKQRLGQSEKQEHSGPNGRELFGSMSDEELNKRIEELQGK